jgi:hypothetical protein
MLTHNIYNINMFLKYSIKNTCGRFAWARYRRCSHIEYSTINKPDSYDYIILYQVIWYVLILYKMYIKQY